MLLGGHKVAKILYIGLPIVTLVNSPIVTMVNCMSLAVPPLYILMTRRRRPVDPGGRTSGNQKADFVCLITGPSY